MTTQALEDVEEAGNVSPTRQKVLKVAARLFALRGFSGVGVNEIGEATGLGRGALYYHISSKEDLLCDIMTAYMTELLLDAQSLVATEPDPVARIHGLSRALMCMIFEHLAELTVCFREVHALTNERRAAVLGLHAGYHAVWSATIAEGVKLRVFRPISSVVLKGLLGMYFHSFLWIDPNGPENAEQVGETFAEIVLRTIAPPSKPKPPPFASFS
jgi:AcrR family transcriptional regulator